MMVGTNVIVVVNGDCMKIIKKEPAKQEKSEDAEISENENVQGKDGQAEKTPQGQRHRNRRPPAVPPATAKSIKPREPTFRKDTTSSNPEVSKKLKSKDKKDKSFIDFLNSLLNLDL